MALGGGAGGLMVRGCSRDVCRVVGLTMLVVDTKHL